VSTAEAGTAAARHAELAAPRLLLSRMGVSPADLLAAPQDAPAMQRAPPVRAAALALRLTVTA
jgi:hypothetical protein